MNSGIQNALYSSKINIILLLLLLLYGKAGTRSE